MCQLSSTVWWLLCHATCSTCPACLVYHSISRVNFDNMCTFRGCRALSWTIGDSIAFLYSRSSIKCFTLWPALLVFLLPLPPTLSSRLKRVLRPTRITWTYNGFTCIVVCLGETTFGPNIHKSCATSSTSQLCHHLSQGLRAYNRSSKHEKI